MAATPNAMLAIIKNQKVSVFKLCRVVLMGKLSGTKSPDHVSGDLFDDEDRASLSEAQQKISVPQLRHAVTVCPLMASFEGAYDLMCWKEVV